MSGEKFNIIEEKELSGGKIRRKQISMKSNDLNEIRKNIKIIKIILQEEAGIVNLKPKPQIKSEGRWDILEISATWLDKNEWMAKRILVYFKEDEKQFGIEINSWQDSLGHRRFKHENIGTCDINDEKCIRINIKKAYEIILKWKANQLK